LSDLPLDEHGALAAVRCGFPITPGTDYGRALQQLIEKGLVERRPDGSLRAVQAR
jgi:hypothetical protein